PSADGAVLEQLRTWRRERARRSGAPAYTVFTDATLEAIAERDPRSPSELLAVPGVGPAKVESYGHEVLELLGSHRSRTAENGWNRRSKHGCAPGAVWVDSCPSIVDRRGPGNRGARSREELSL